jgi:hypothetical protein
MFDLVRSEVQDAVETMRRGDWEETRHNLEHVLMYTEAVATFWRSRAMERGGSEEPASSHVPIPGTVSGRDVHATRWLAIADIKRFPLDPGLVLTLLLTRLHWLLALLLALAIAPELVRHPKNDDL